MWDWEKGILSLELMSLGWWSGHQYQIKSEFNYKTAEKTQTEPDWSEWRKWMGGEGSDRKNDKKFSTNKIITTMWSSYSSSLAHRHRLLSLSPPWPSCQSQTWRWRRDFLFAFPSWLFRLGLHCKTIHYLIHTHLSQSGQCANNHLCNAMLWLTTQLQLTLNWIMTGQLSSSSTQEMGESLNFREKKSKNCMAGYYRFKQHGA